MVFITTKKILLLPIVVMISIMFFSINTVTAAGPLDTAGIGNFAILAATYTNSGSTGTILNGNLGYTTAPANPPTVNGVIFADPNPTYVSAQAARANLLAAANDPSQSGPCTTTLGVATVLDSLPQPLTPGVYCIGGAASIANGITLGSDGVYIFRITGTLNVAQSSMVTLGNAKADKIFWVPTGATDLGEDSIFAGNILSNAAITVHTTVSMEGRILSNGAVTTEFLVAITAPLVTIAPPLNIIPAIIPSESCDDCVPPTLGLDSDNRRMVDQGFSYDGNPSNVELFLTPLQSSITKVGVVNKAVFKIYEDGGPNEVRHFEFIFGLAKGQILGDSKAMIELDRSWDGIDTVKITDPEHALKDVKVETSQGPCKTGAITNDCLIVTIYHTFVTPLEFNIIATNVWDEHRNSWQNYFTPGVKVVGESVIVPIPVIPLVTTVLISDLNITKSKVMVGDTIHVSFRVTDDTGKTIPWVTPDVGICKVSATKPHYVLVTPESPLSKDSDCPFFQSDFLSSSDVYNINLVVPEGITLGEYKLDVWADPDYIGQSGVTGDHKSVDISVVSITNNPSVVGGEYGVKLPAEGIKSPLKQFQTGVAINKIQCKEGLQLVIRASSDDPACVKPATKTKLIERGWAKSQV